RAPLEENPNGGHASQGPGGHHPHVNSVGRYRWPGGPAVLPRIRHLPAGGARDLRANRLSPAARPSHPAGQRVRGGAGAHLGVAGPAVMADAAGGAASSASAPRRGAAGGREPRAPGAVGRGSRAPGAVGRGSRAPDAVGRGSRAARARPPRAAQLPYLFVLAVTIGALGWIWQGGVQHAKEGTLALAGAM